MGDTNLKIWGQNIDPPLYFENYPDLGRFHITGLKINKLLCHDYIKKRIR